MKRLCLFSATAGVLLGSATLPASRPAPPPVQEAHHVAPPVQARVMATAVPAPAPAKAVEAAAPPPAPAEPYVGASVVRVVISIPQQKAYVFKGEDLFATSPVSTGKRGHETPVGTFRILQKDIDHRSNRYSNAPMPFMQRLTSYGIALHAGRLPGYPASHGCIRLPRSFAKRLYGITGTGTKVTVTRRRPASSQEALTLA